MVQGKPKGRLAVFTLLLACGCYFLRYDALTRTHVEVLTAMAEKRSDLIGAGMAGRDDGEFRYPLERARDFARIVGDRFGKRESHRRLMALIDRYEDGLDETGKDGAATAAGEVTALGREVLAALDAED